MSVQPEPPPLGEKMRSHPIGRVEFDSLRLGQDLRTIDSFQMSPAYSEYAKGDWSTCILVNRTGNKDDGFSEEFEGRGVPTEYGRRVPYLLEITERLFKTEHLKSARIFSARQGFIIPHRDYLEFKKGFTRLHVVLSTNDGAMNSERRTVYRMREGEIWFLDGRLTHSGGAFTDQKRLHLVLDFDPDVPIQSLFKNPAKYQPGLMPLLIRRPSIANEKLEEILTSLGAILTELTYDTVFELAAKLHFSHDLDCEWTYNGMIEIASRSGNRRLLEKANSAQQYFLGEFRKAS